MGVRLLCGHTRANVFSTNYGAPCWCDVCKADAAIIAPDGLDLLERAHELLDAQGVPREGRMVWLPGEPKPLLADHPRVRAMLGILDKPKSIGKKGSEAND